MRFFVASCRSACIWLVLLLIVPARSEGVSPEPSTGEQRGGSGSTVREPLVFTDEKAVVENTSLDGPKEAEVTLLTVKGWETSKTVTVTFTNGKAGIEPVGEGIHVVRVAETEARFLAISPPPEIRPEAVRRSLPTSSQKLLGGEPVTILALGDSVTATGEYPEILRRMLARATKNPHVSVVVKGHPGRSVDASVRLWAKEGPPNKPDLGLIMYGLNDQAAGSSLPAFVEQTRYLVDRLREIGSDAILLEPTPHIQMSASPDANSAPPAAASIFRTITFAGVARDLARELKIPLARTFDALWQEGGLDSASTARKLWPVFPLSYSRQYTSMLEAGGRGDTIHPNALGHLALARAVFNTINGAEKSPALVCTGVTRWLDGSLVSTLTVKNQSESTVEGRLTLYPFPQDDRHEEQEYSLAPGKRLELTFKWPGIANASDLLADPYAIIFDRPGPFIQMVDYRDSGSQVTAVPVPLLPRSAWVRERHTANARETFASFEAGDTKVPLPVTIPADSEVGRIPIFRETKIGGRTIPAAADLFNTRYGAAAEHEATADGDLSEWADARWIPVGERMQAQANGQTLDGRKSVEECYLRWAFAGGKDGLHLAFRGTGELLGDRFTVYFDPREPALLGSAGPYFWVEGKFAPDGNLLLRAGDSSPEGTKPVGRWKHEGGEMHGELFLPYALMTQNAWPASGDLGVSIVWHHPHPGGKTTRLMWSDHGHPWNTRWFGVVRLGAGEDRPFVIRVQ